MATNNISEVLAQNGLTVIAMESARCAVEGPYQGARVRRVLETVARLHEQASSAVESIATEMRFSGEETQSVKNARATLASLGAILVEVLR